MRGVAALQQSYNTCTVTIYSHWAYYYEKDIYHQGIYYIIYIIWFLHKHRQDQLNAQKHLVD